MGPWMVPWVVVCYMLREYGIELYLTQLKYFVCVIFFELRVETVRNLRQV